MNRLPVNRLPVSRQCATDRIALGRTTYARNLQMGDSEVEAAKEERAGALFTREAYLVAGGPAWQSDALTARDHSIAVIAALVAQQVVDDRLTPYLNLARRSGVTEEGLETLMVLLASYLGQPATSLGAAAVLKTRPRSA